jgi:hypothetical protein
MTQVIAMAQQFFNTVTTYIKDPDTIEAIAFAFEQIMTNPPDDTMGDNK